MNEVKNKLIGNEKFKNILLCIFALVGTFVLPSVFSLIFMSFKLPVIICDTFGQLIFIALLVYIYLKDLKKEFKNYKNNFKSNISKGFKYYILGYMAMIFFNLIIVSLLKDVSTNENQVRELLFNNTLIAIINISIFAPIAEELAFRKSLFPLFKNKYVYAITSGILFGGAHLTINFLTNTFVLTDLIYILPYGSLGFMFALMNFDTKSTFTSITMHCFHNTVTCILLLLSHFSGVM